MSFHNSHNTFVNELPARRVSRFDMFKSRQGIVLALAVGVLTLAACQFDHERAGPLQEEPVSVDLGNTERANVELNMGAGEMNVRSGANKLLEGKFEYNVSGWKPELHTSNIGSHATITIRQPEHVHVGGSTRYLWDLHLSNRVLLDLALQCGAGKAQLDLGDLELRSVDVHMGAGQVDLDLRGKPSRDYDVNISGGVGQATVHLPQDVGVMAEAHGGLGSITVTGLQKRGDYWQNDLYDTAKVNVRLKVEGGIGEIRIIG
jgi:hypothetical protein